MIGGPEGCREYRRRDGLRRYSFTYDNGTTATFHAEQEEQALKLCRDAGVFQDLQDGKIVSFEWAKYLRSA